MSDRGFFRIEDGKLTPIDKPKVISVEAPFVQTDEIEPTMSMTGTDKIHTSKATLRREYKELGFIETGGEKAPPPKLFKANKHDIAESVKKSLQDLRYNNVETSEMEKERCRREERAYRLAKQRKWAGTKAKRA